MGGKWHIIGVRVLATIDSTDSHKYMWIFFGFDPIFEEVSGHIGLRIPQGTGAIETGIFLPLHCTEVFAVAQ